MLHCPVCMESYGEGHEVCWPCGARLVEGDLEEEAPSRQWTELSPVYLAPDELSALRIEAVLEEAEISATVQSAQIPWIDGVMLNIKGYWGRVLVHPDDRELAAELVAAYLASLDGSREP